MNLINHILDYVNASIQRFLEIIDIKNPLLNIEDKTTYDVEFGPNTEIANEEKNDHPCIEITIPLFN